MMRLKALGSVKARLLILLVFIAIPVLALTMVLATLTYRSELRTLEQSQMRFADEFAIRSRIWMRGTLRIVETTLSTAPLGAGNMAACQEQVAGVLRASPTFKALYVAGENRSGCLAATEGFMDDAALRALVITVRDRPATDAWIPSSTNRFRYDTVTFAGASYFVFYVQTVPPDRSEFLEGMLVVDPFLLDQVFDLGIVDRMTTVGIVANRQDILAARGTAEQDNTWLPRVWPPGPLPGRWSADAANGVAGQYAARLVAEPGLYVLASFNGSAENAALRRYLIMCAAPLLMLAVMYAASWSFIQTNIVRGIAGIEQAAKAEIDGHDGVLAPIDPGMPEDIRKVASAFNRMVTEAASREMTLRASLEANQHLMRELHHRVKNSLQVIQSYLALTRREQPDQGGEILRDAEAKVQVLAVAYRFALTAHGMQDVPVQPFVQELLSNLSDAARRSDRRIDAEISTKAGFPVDRAIPLGLAIVEVAFSCIKHSGCGGVKVVLVDEDTGGLSLTISAHGMTEGGLAPTKTLIGLRLQLDAQNIPVDPPIMLNWHIAAGHTS